MSTLEDLAERVERLLLRHDELQRTNALLRQQLAEVGQERDSLRSRLNAARGRIDQLLDRLPADTLPAVNGTSPPPDTPPTDTAAAPLMNQKEVTILGQSYLLSCPDGGETAFYEAVAQVDREMSAIRDAGKIKARERIAVLAALNLAYQLASRPPATTTTTTTGGEGQSVGDTAVDLGQLVQRIDQRLSADGQLI